MRKPCVGRLLHTKDGRALGNAIITGPCEIKDWGTVWPVETDFGNRLKMTANEIVSCFHMGKHTSVKRWRQDRHALRQPLGEPSWRIKSERLMP